MESDDCEMEQEIFSNQDYFSPTSFLPRCHAKLCSKLHFRLDDRAVVVSPLAYDDSEGLHVQTPCKCPLRTLLHREHALKVNIHYLLLYPGKLIPWDLAFGNAV